VKFVEAQQSRIVRKIARYRRDRIRFLQAFHRLASNIQPVLHVGHEFMEMRAALLFDLRRFEEEVHQHGLPAANIPPDIKSARRSRLRTTRHQPTERRGFRRTPVRGEFVLERLQTIDSGRLGGIPLQRAAFGQLRIAFGNSRHASRRPL
jgi:hypothetical protein